MNTTKCMMRYLLLCMVSVLVFAGNAVQARSLPDFTELVQQNRAAVVNISTTQKRQVTRQQPACPRDSRFLSFPRTVPFQEFFRRFFGEGEMEEFEAQSLGSGFIISSDGYLISNNHVIKDADEIIVRLSDRREFNAELVVPILAVTLHC